MMRRVIVLLCLVSVCGAEDLVTRSGRVYRNVVVNVAGHGIRVVHDGGVAKVAYADLTDAQREAYGLTAEGAAEAAENAAEAGDVRKQQAEEKKAAEAEQKRVDSLPEWIVSGRIDRILDDGSLVLRVTPVRFVPASGLRSIGGGVRNEGTLRVRYATEEIVLVTKPMVRSGGYAEGERWQESAVRLGTRKVDGQVLRVYQAREKGTK